MPHADFLELVLADEVSRRESGSAALRARAAGLDPAMHLDGIFSRGSNVRPVPLRSAFPRASPAHRPALTSSEILLIIYVKLVWIELHLNRVAVSRQTFHSRAATQGFGSMPMRSLTADRIRCLQPR